MSPVTLTLRFTMRSDWRTGTGSGRMFGLDRVVDRDPDGLPWLPAKTVKGIWRDATETAAQALGGDWVAAVDLLFGDRPSRRGAGRVDAPRPGRLHVGPARMTAAVRVPLGRAGAEPLRSATTLAKAGVMIDPSSGRAVDEALRTMELARSGAVLAATAVLDVADDASAALVALAVVGARAIERVGAERRRGAGRCRITVRADGLPSDDAMADLLGGAAPKAGVAAARGLMPAPRTTQSGADWSSLVIDVELDSPLLVAERVLGNEVRTLHYVPGGMLLAALGRASGQASAWWRAVAHGDLLVTSATPVVGGGRGRPAPFVLRRPKGSDGLEKVRSVLTDEYEADTQLKEIRTGWLGMGVSGELPAYAEPALESRTHATIDEEHQRPTAAVGGVYTYEALAAGQRLRACLRVRGDGTELAEKLAGRAIPARLGRSKADGYGAVTLRCSQALEPAGVGTAREGDEHVLWLTSPAIVVDRFERPCVTLPGLCTAVQQRLEQAGHADASVTAAAALADDVPVAILRTTRVESWNVSWGLPRASAPALAAGSVARVCVRGVPKEALAKVLAGGVGELRAEGYGEVLVDDPLLTEKLRDQAGEAGVPVDQVAGEPSADPGPLDDAERQYLEIVERAAWEREIALAADRAVGDVKAARARFLWNASKPRAAQIGSVRNGLLNGDDDTVLRRVRHWVSHAREKDKGRQEPGWPQGSLDVLERFFTEEDEPWSVLQGAGMSFDGLSAVSTREQMQARLRVTAIRALFAAAARAHVRKLQASAGTRAQQEPGR